MVEIGFKTGKLMVQYDISNFCPILVCWVFHLQFFGKRLKEYILPFIYILRGQIQTSDKSRFSNTYMRGDIILKKMALYLQMQAE